MKDPSPLSSRTYCELIALRNGGISAARKWQVLRIFPFLYLPCRGGDRKDEAVLHDTNDDVHDTVPQVRHD